MADPTIPKGEAGHPIKHKMVLGPFEPVHDLSMHPGGNMLTSYYGMIWWDNETDGNLMYPTRQPDLTDEQLDSIQQRNPEGAAMRGLWGQDPGFLQKMWTDINPKAQRTQFGDFHGHGWVYRNVYKSDRKGNMVTANGKPISPDDPDKFKKQFIWKTFTRRRACIAPIVTSARTSTATATSTTSRGPRSRSTVSIATALLTSRRP